MKQLDSFFLKQHYDASVAEKDKLRLIEATVNWESFRPILSSIRKSRTKKGGNPGYDEIVMTKMFILQSLYSLSDEGVEFNSHDRLSFRRFIGFDQKVPDHCTIWRFRQALADKNIDGLVHEEFMRQVEEEGFKVKKGVMQDAAIIESDIGKKRSSKEYKEKKKEEEATTEKEIGESPSTEKKKEKSKKKVKKYTKKQERHIDKDASFVKKNKKSYHGYKLHIKTDIDNDFIREYTVTTASVHDSQVDLVKEGDKLAIRDKGYAGTELKCSGVRDCTMHKAARNRPLSDQEKWENKILSRVRVAVERPFAFIKGHFGRGRTNLKRQPRVRVQQFFNVFTYNILNLALRRKRREEKLKASVVSVS